MSNNPTVALIAPFGVIFLALLSTGVARSIYSSEAALPKSFDQTAWEVLVASTGDSSTVFQNENPVAWRKWTTAQEVYQSNPAPPPLEAPFEYPSMRSLQCGQSGQNPKSTDVNARCEVIFLDPFATQYVVAKGLSMRENLNRVALEGLKYPNNAKEIKTEWIPIDNSPSNYIIGRTADGARYGLVAFHMKAKVLDSQWLWATWIKKGSLPTGYPTHDSFGQSTDPTVSQAFKSLLDSNGASILQNYLLIGTQTNDDLAKKTQLGNPLIEGLDPTLKVSSCIGCHQNAAVSKVGGWAVPNDPKRMSSSNPLPPGKNSTDNDWVSVETSTCHHSNNNCTERATAAIK
jgi:hypothetical protein